MPSANYILLALCSTVIAADASGMQGSWANRLGLPLGSVAQYIGIVVPVIFILGFVIPSQKEYEKWRFIIPFIALLCILFPYLVFHFQTNKIILDQDLSIDTRYELEEKFGSQVMIMSCGSESQLAYISNKVDKEEVEHVIWTSPKPQSNEIK